MHGTTAAARAALTAGRGLVLLDRYELGEMLGAGGMAIVFQGQPYLSPRCRPKDLFAHLLGIIAA